MITFERMDNKQFKDYLKFMLPDYIRDTAEHYKLDTELATEKAEKQMEQLLPDEEKTEGQHLFQIKSENELAGYLWFHVSKEEKKAFLYHIYLLDAFRKRGIAQAALRFFENESKDEGADYVGLHVFGSNENAIALYTKLGYKQASISMNKVL
ncbi:GNAT family N-acetyltransferase [Fictibacillus phosphorivorans]|uniref:GNAT family N-acetyltransferase n=1 Tax=Fictibacillus phosphorivorans TaxID=1221500 RepID=UPI0011A3F664|nr:GNAT family N-acetyltransferase [Fictibacillus phosphorivorans]